MERFHATSDADPGAISLAHDTHVAHLKERGQYTIAPQQWQRVISPIWFSRPNCEALERVMIKAIRKEEEVIWGQERTYAWHTPGEPDTLELQDEGNCSSVGVWDCISDFQVMRTPLGVVSVLLVKGDHQISSMQRLMVEYSYFPEVKPLIERAASSVLELFNGRRNRFEHVLGAEGALRRRIGPIGDVYGIPQIRRKKGN